MILTVEYHPGYTNDGGDMKKNLACFSYSLIVRQEVDYEQ